MANLAPLLLDAHLRDTVGSSPFEEWWSQLDVFRVQIEALERVGESVATTVALGAEEWRLGVSRLTTCAQANKRVLSAAIPTHDRRRFANMNSVVFSCPGADEASSLSTCVAAQVKELVATHSTAPEEIDRFETKNDASCPRPTCSPQAKGCVTDWVIRPGVSSYRSTAEPSGAPQRRLPPAEKRVVTVRHVAPSAAMQHAMAA